MKLKGCKVMNVLWKEEKRIEKRKNEKKKTDCLTLNTNTNFRYYIFTYLFDELRDEDCENYGHELYI